MGGNSQSLCERCGCGGLSWGQKKPWSALRFDTHAFVGGRYVAEQGNEAVKALALEHDLIYKKGDVIVRTSKGGSGLRRDWWKGYIENDPNPKPKTGNVDPNMMIQLKNKSDERPLDFSSDDDDIEDASYYVPKKARLEQAHKRKLKMKNSFRAGAFGNLHGADEEEEDDDEDEAKLASLRDIVIKSKLVPEDEERVLAVRMPGGGFQ